MKLSKVLGALGRILLTAGVLTLLFVAYQLWGTGIHEARAQSSLSNEFEDFLAAEETAVSEDGTDETAEQSPPPLADEGDAVARIEIPSLGVDKIVVEGVGVEDLKRGPGHFRNTPLPGQAGNAAIAGHRTTYGAPFHDIDKLGDSDEIVVTTVEGELRYEFEEQLIVAPDDVEVLDDYGDNRLTLVACHPKYSAAQRIVVVAELDESERPARPASDAASDGPPELPSEATDDDSDPSGDSEHADDLAGPAAYSDLDGGAGLSGDRSGAWPAVLLALACAAIWLTAWLATKLVKPWISYAVGTPIFLLVLFFFFEATSRFVPANF